MNTLKVNQSEKELSVENSEIAGYDFGARTLHWVSNQSFALRHLTIARSAKEGNCKKMVERQEKEFHRWTLIFRFYGSNTPANKEIYSILRLTNNLAEYEHERLFDGTFICWWGTAFFIFCYYLEHR